MHFTGRVNRTVQMLQLVATFARHLAQMCEHYLCDCCFILISLVVNSLPDTPGWSRSLSTHRWLSTAASFMAVSFGSTSSTHTNTPQDVHVLALHLAGESIEHKAPWWLSHLARREELMYGDKIPISWTAAMCQACLLLSNSQSLNSVIGDWLCMWHALCTLEAKCSKARIRTTDFTMFLW